MCVDRFLKSDPLSPTDHHRGCVPSLSQGVSLDIVKWDKLGGHVHPQLNLPLSAPPDDAKPSHFDNGRKAGQPNCVTSDTVSMNGQELR